jgi:hypothetical protein
MPVDVAPWPLLPVPVLAPEPVGTLLPLAPDGATLPERELLPLLAPVEPRNPDSGPPVFIVAGPPPLPLLPQAAARIERPNHAVTGRAPLVIESLL